MIVRDKPSFLVLFFIFRGSVIERIYPQVLAVMLLSAAIVWGHNNDPGIIPSVIGAPFALIGISLSVFLGFRNSACYDRWWEARKLWGHLLAVSRDFARQSLLLSGSKGGSKLRQHLLNLNIEFAAELVRHLRTSAEPAGSTRLTAEEAAELRKQRNKPDYLLRLMGGLLAAERHAGRISDIEFTLLDRTVSEMNGVLTACERLRNTPVPFGYMLLLHRTAYLFCFMLPFGFADVLGYVTPLAAGVVAYTFFGLDALSEELEEPFGTLPNDLPIAAIAKAIELSLREALGEKDLPELPKPVNSILL
ncbi:bestrophin family ion channel [Rhizobium sp. OAE497]|uniref:bestrophin family protein n=1 Tax=Rhizobium sp. OAE497 TaxID=2663796 RepID=UPI0018F5FE96